MKKTLTPNYSRLTSLQTYLWIYLSPIALYPLAMIVAASLKKSENLYGSIVESSLWIYPIYLMISAGIILLINRRLPSFAKVLLVFGYLLIFVYVYLVVTYVI